MKSIIKKKKFRCLLLLREKGCFYCIKQRPTYFDIPLFELLSLADRFTHPLSWMFGMFERKVSGKTLLLP